jgi:hypothetical protein
MDGHVASTVEIKSAYKFLVGKPIGKRSLCGIDVDGRLTLKWILYK